MNNQEVKVISLRQMTEDEFKSFMDYSIPEYAREKMKAEGLSKEGATKLAKESFAELLPQGLLSKDQYLFSVVRAEEKNRSIGSLWFAKKNNGTRSYAYIYDIFLNPDVRGKGFGKEVMVLLESEVKKQGLSSIGLHVFGHNKTAIRLYEKSGYLVTNQIMMKEI
jgi:ribosomal protein S18 acetylase RimI-like enzyme